MSMNDGESPSVSGSDVAGPQDADPVPGLVHRSLSGDDEAFAQIFGLFRERIYRIAFRFTHDHDDAMDLTQTTFIKVHRSLSSYREESSFSTWISRIATNCGIDWVRAKKREGKVGLDDAPELPTASLPDSGLSGPRPGPARSVEQAELGEAIREAVDALSEKHRSVFVLHCVEGTPYKDIAEILDISIGTVMSRLFHARRYLRRSLEPYLGESRVRTLLKHEEEREDGRRREAGRGER